LFLDVGQDRGRQHLQDGQRRHRAHRVPAEGRAVVSRPQNVGDPFIAQHRRHRHSTAQSFGQRKDVRCHSVSLVAENISRAAQTALDAVKQEKEAPVRSASARKSERNWRVLGRTPPSP